MPVNDNLERIGLVVEANLGLNNVTMIPRPQPIAVINDGMKFRFIIPLYRITHKNNDYLWNFTKITEDEVHEGGISVFVKFLRGYNEKKSNETALFL